MEKCLEKNILKLHIIQNWKSAILTPWNVDKVMLDHFNNIVMTQREKNIGQVLSKISSLIRNYMYVGISEKKVKKTKAKDHTFSDSNWSTFHKLLFFRLCILSHEKTCSLCLLCCKKVLKERFFSNRECVIIWVMRFLRCRSIELNAQPKTRKKTIMLHRVTVF